MWVYSSSQDIDLIERKQKVVLVGGFAESPYVHSRIESWCRMNNVSVKKPDGPLSKAIAHGALSWHLHSGVRTRIARLHYGAEVHISYDPDDPEMIGREKYMDPNGDWKVRGAWQEIVRKVKNLTRSLFLLSVYSSFYCRMLISELGKYILLGSIKIFGLSMMRKWRWSSLRTVGQNRPNFYIVKVNKF